MVAPALATYSFLDVTGSIIGPGGAFDIGAGAGVAPEGITIEMLEEKDLASIGADGALMHSLRANNAARVTVRLLKTAPANAQLMNLYNFQRQNSSAWGQNSIRIADTQRGDVEAFSSVAFARQANNVYAQDAGFMEWIFIGNREALLGAGVPNLSV